MIRAVDWTRPFLSTKFIGLRSDESAFEKIGVDQRGLGRAKAQADANQLLNASLTPTLVQWQAIQKWNGNMPNVTGGAMPFIDVTPKKQ